MTPPNPSLCGNNGPSCLCVDLQQVAQRIEAGELIADKSMSDSEFLAPLLENDE